VSTGGETARTRGDVKLLSKPRVYEGEGRHGLRHIGKKKIGQRRRVGGGRAFTIRKGLANLCEKTSIRGKATGVFIDQMEPLLEKVKQILGTDEKSSLRKRGKKVKESKGRSLHGEKDIQSFRLGGKRSCSKGWGTQ